MAFVVILLASFHIGMSGDPLLAMAVFLVNVVWNFYPAILQRYQRSRLRGYDDRPRDMRQGHCFRKEKDSLHRSATHSIGTFGATGARFDSG
jgi:hypothetical protein